MLIWPFSRDFVTAIKSLLLFCVDAELVITLDRGRQTPSGTFILYLTTKSSIYSWEEYSAILIKTGFYNRLLNSLKLNVLIYMESELTSTYQ